MARFCPVGMEEFDDSIPMCPVHFQPTRPAQPSGPVSPPPEPDAPVPALDRNPASPGTLSVQVAGITQALLPGPGLLIGRGPRSPFGPQLEGIGWTNVSGLHCILRLTEAGQVEVLDLDSRNGTFVDGVRLCPNIPRILVPGESLRLAANREVILTWS